MVFCTHLHFANFIVLYLISVSRSFPCTYFTMNPSICQYPCGFSICSVDINQLSEQIKFNIADAAFFFPSVFCRTF